jgi:solute carrier family 45 protein 1/2/4
LRREAASLQCFYTASVRSGSNTCSCLRSLSIHTVGVITGTLLPYLASRDRRLMGHKDDVDEDAELNRLRDTVREWRAEAARHGKPLRLPMMPFLLRNIWTGALILFSILTFSTFFISTVVQVTSYSSNEVPHH